MSRITKALEKLRVKCTEAGAHPNGKDTADILECIAEHYAGGGGGTDPVVENAKETGGIGYTDEDETIHKIDEKYLPSGGGVMVVEVDYDGEQFVSTKTVDEVKNAMLTMPVIGIAKFNGEFFGVGIFTWLFDGGDSGFDDNTPVVNASFYKSVEDVYQFIIQPIIAVSDGEFVING